FCCLLSVSRSGHLPDLHSFPTRRSSDLGGMEGGVHITSQGDSAVRVRFTAGDAEERWRGVRRLVSRLDDLRLPAISGVAATYDSDRKSTRLNSSHVKISYAVFCLKKKNK